MKKETLDCPFDFTSRCTMGRCDCKPKQDDINYSLNAFKVPKEYFGNEEPKQETLEEAAAKKLYPLNDGFQVMDIDISEELQLAFINGAKWQKENSYSEEEVMDMFHNLSMHLPLHYEFLVKEQFKNK